MTLRNVRIPRLTLFTGPNCSLCDVNISSSEYEFQLTATCRLQNPPWRGCANQCVTPLKTILSTHSLHFMQRHFELDTVNIQEPGQEKWKKEYVYWIPALRLDGKEIAKGRWNDQTVIQALEKWNQLQQETLPEKP